MTDQAGTDDRRASPERRRADLERSRRERAHLLNLRAVTFVCCVLLGVVGYGIAHTLPELRRVQDAQVCGYRAVANRETRLAQHDRTRAGRALHQTSADSFRALAHAAAADRHVRCRPLLNEGTRP